jgi:hypothetical protein
MRNQQNKELVALLQEQDIAKKIADGYEVRGIFVTNAARDKNAIDFLNEFPQITLYDAEELQKSYIPLEKTPPIATEIAFDVSTVPHMPFSVGAELDMVIARWRPAN